MTTGPTIAPRVSLRLVPQVAPWWQRLLAGAVAGAGLALLVVAQGLTPDASGLGTHHQLGLEACGFLKYTGLPCATCGMTTAVSHAAHGQLLAAAVAQPAGAAFALAVAAAVLVAGYAAVTGMATGPVLRWVWRPTTMWVVLGLGALAWGYKVLVVLLT